MLFAPPALALAMIPAIVSDDPIPFSFDDLILSGAAEAPVGKMQAADPLDMGLNSVACLSDGTLSLLIAPSDYSHAMTVAYGVTDFDVLWHDNSSLRDDLVLIRNGKVEWWKWDSERVPAAFVPTDVPGLWDEAVRVAARGPNSGSYGMLAVADRDHRVHLCFTTLNTPLFYSTPISVNGEVLGLAVSDLNRDGLFEAAIQTTEELRVVDFLGNLILVHPLQVSETHLTVLDRGAEERIAALGLDADGRWNLNVLGQDSVEEPLGLDELEIRSFDSGDLNNDAQDDLLVVYPRGVEMFLGDRSGAFDRVLPPFQRALDGLQGMCLTDLDNDGDADVVASDGLHFTRARNGTTSHFVPIVRAVIDSSDEATVEVGLGNTLANQVSITLWRRESSDGPVVPVPVAHVLVPLPAPSTLLQMEGWVPGSKAIVEVRPLGAVGFPAFVGEVQPYPVDDPYDPDDPYGPPDDTTPTAPTPPPALPVPYVPPFAGTPVLPWF